MYPPRSTYIVWVWLFCPMRVRCFVLFTLNCLRLGRSMQRSWSDPLWKLYCVVMCCMLRAKAVYLAGTCKQYATIVQCAVLCCVQCCEHLAQSRETKSNMGNYWWPLMVYKVKIKTVSCEHSSGCSRTQKTSKNMCFIFWLLQKSPEFQICFSVFLDSLPLSSRPVFMRGWPFLIRPYSSFRWEGFLSSCWAPFF